MLRKILILSENNPRAIDIQAFIDEAFIMKDFNHPRVLKLLGICLGLDDMPLVVLPFLQRGDLLTFLRDEHNVSIMFSKKCLKHGNPKFYEEDIQLAYHTELRSDCCLFIRII